MTHSQLGLAGLQRKSGAKPGGELFSVGKIRLCATNCSKGAGPATAAATAGTVQAASACSYPLSQGCTGPASHPQSLKVPAPIGHQAHAIGPARHCLSAGASIAGRQASGNGNGDERRALRPVVQRRAAGDQLEKAGAWDARACSLRLTLGVLWCRG